MRSGSPGLTVQVTIMTTRHRCECPICDWKGRQWDAVESRPKHMTRKICPQCGSYPRDRITSLLLLAHAEELPIYHRLKLIEFGELGRAYFWKKAFFDYWNIDLKESGSGFIDVFAEEMMTTPCLRNSDTALISYVLSMIENRPMRVSLLSRFYELTTDRGRLILFDDFAFDRKPHLQLSPKLFFHRVRFGSAILAELRDAGWSTLIVSSYRRSRILSSLDIPFLVASKSNDTKALRKWIRSARSARKRVALKPAIFQRLDAGEY